MPKDTKIRTRLIKYGIYRLKESGYLKVDSSNIFKNKEYRNDFKTVLKQYSGTSTPYVNSVIREMIEEINEMNIKCL